MKSDPDGPKTPKKQRQKRQRKPHNATLRSAYLSLEEMMQAIATEERRVPFAGGEVMMSRRELSFRNMIARAFKGQVHDLAHLLRLMEKYPELPATVVPTIVIRGFV
jgi:hypothetical protein